MKKFLMCAVLLCAGGITLSAQIIKQQDLEKYPFVEKDNKKRTCAKALVMTHAYSNVVLDKIEEAVKNGLVGNEDDDW